jgi:hypothetical protein
MSLDFPFICKIVRSSVFLLLPLFCYIMSLHNVVMHVTCLHRLHFLLFVIDIWLNTRSCRKSKAGQSELGSCKLKFYVVIFHAQISTRIDR